MTILSQIISDAYRESNLLAISATQTAAEQNEGLRLLNRFIVSLIGNELGELLEDSAYGSNNVSRPDTAQGWLDDRLNASYLPENIRIVANTNEAKTVYLAPTPHDGARVGITNPSANLSTAPVTLNGNGRRIEDSTSVVLSTDGLTREWFYRADLSNWVRLTELAANEDSPFPNEFDDLLTIGLAMRINPRNNTALAGETIETYRGQLKKFKSRYRQSKQMSSEEGILRLSSNYWYRSYENFDRG